MSHKAVHDKNPFLESIIRNQASIVKRKKEVTLYISSVKAKKKRGRIWLEKQ